MIDPRDATTAERAKRTAAAGLRQWFALALSIAILWGAIFVVIPAAQRLPAIAPAVQTLRESGIEVSAIYYTGVEKVAEAEAAMRAASDRAVYRSPTR